jgi:Tol biopolymer transport system component
MDRHGASLKAASLMLLLAASGCASPQQTVSRPPPSAASASPSSLVTSGQLPVGRIIFDRYRGGPEGTYLGSFMLDATGESEIEFPVSAEERRAVASPDGRTLLVDSWAMETGSFVDTLDLATGAYTPLAHGLVGDIHCSDWAPSGSSVVCSLSSDVETDDGLYAVQLDGTVTRLTHSAFHVVEGSDGSCGGGEGRAVYAPDGGRFAYEQQQCGLGPDPGRGEQGAVVVADADGTHAVTIVPFGGVRTHPGGEIDWSPAGDQIAFATQDGVLSVVNADGTDLRSIELPVPGFVSGPAWSPDGAWILVAVDAGRGSDLYAVTADGSAAIQLTRTPESEVFTDWGVRPGT